VIESIGAGPACAATVATAAVIGPDQVEAGDEVVAAQKRKMAAGNPIHRCHFRQNNSFTTIAPG
jgi:hypothetical protein